jgi:hypothetical protein
MLHGILFVLGILGTVILWILGILLFLILLVLFVPFRYKLHLRKMGEPFMGGARLTWLFHFMQLDAVYKEKKALIELMILGKSLKKISLPDKKEKAPPPDTEASKEDGAKEKEKKREETEDSPVDIFAESPE